MDHDHGTGSDDSGTTTTRLCPMNMIFHTGHCERILWNGWLASTVVEFVFSALAIFMMGIIYEALKFIREKQQRKANQAARLEMQRKNGSSVECSNTPLAEMERKSYIQEITNKQHLFQTTLNLIQIIISYILMMVFMLMNYWLCLALVLGLGMGYFFFGWLKKDAYDSECCG